IPYASRGELVIVATLGCLNIALFAVISSIWETNPIFPALIFLLAYLLQITGVLVWHKSVATVSDCEDIYEFLASDCSTVFKNTKSPVTVFDSYGTVLWCNDAMKNILEDDENPIDKNVTEVFGLDFRMDAGEEQPIFYNGNLYTAEGFVVSTKNNGLYLISLSDITALTDYKRKYSDERVAVAYIAIDNVEDLLQYVHDTFSDSVSKVDEKLKAWADSLDGIIKPYDNDKYIMFFDSVHLDNLAKSRFEILDEIRDTRVGDGVSVTVSIGVARISGSLKDREAGAREAIDMALQRGGDQVVYKTDGAVEYYGGRTKSVYKRTNVRSRTFTSELTAMIARCDNVIIMGHRYGDFDSFGASVGMAKLVSLCGVKTNIAIDLRDKNLLPSIRKLQETDEYEQTFVDNAEALDLVGPDTLLIVVDVSNLERAQFANVVEKVKNIAVVDHHRKTAELPDTVKLSYIEPSASSACELVGEMLECAVSSQNHLKVEADMLLSGILLDTKQFTRNTGTRTFGVAQYLRGAGASPTDVYDMFKTTTQELSREAHFHTSITTYREKIAISSYDGEADDSYRVIASKAADKMLTLQGIEAAFALVRIGEHIHISGRSNGNINVQLILEKLHGGGHFDVAGAQVVSESVISVLETLKASIDDYLDEM
ncbi:MAG: DHH family phosphoesterase, partial [Clostridia bacterium]|nr:DHH family phosphoesterase [Clostridia bacterium]